LGMFVLLILGMIYIVLTAIHLLITNYFYKK